MVSVKGDEFSMSNDMLELRDLKLGSMVVSDIMGGTACLWH